MSDKKQMPGSFAECWQEITDLRARVARLEAALRQIAGAGGLFAEPASGQYAREVARLALEGALLERAELAALRAGPSAGAVPK